MGQVLMNDVELSSLYARMEAGKSRRFLPLLIVQGYLAFTVFIFAFGPWPWDVRNPITLYTYLFLVQVALLVGYLSKAVNPPIPIYSGHSSRKKWLHISVALSLIAIAPFYYIQLGRLEVSLGGMIAQIVAGATDPGQAYRDTLDSSGSVSHFYLLWAYVLISPILWLCVPLAVSSWETLSFKMKSAIVFIVGANVATWIAMGTVQGIADNAVIIALSIMVSGKKVRLKRKSLVRFVAITAFLATVVFYFSYAQNSRSHGQMITATDPQAGITLDTNNFILLALPPSAQSAVGRGCSYLTQGYYGLSLALSVPFQWTYGVGHSLFWSAFLQHFTGVDVTNLTYPARIDEQFGWSMQVRWDSVYPWLASDLTFPGTLVLMLFIGRLLASTWIDAQVGENPYAPSLFILVMLIILYFPANDKMLTNGFSVGAFWGLLCMWVATHKSANRVRVGVLHSQIS